VSTLVAWVTFGCRLVWGRDLEADVDVGAGGSGLLHAPCRVEVSRCRLWSFRRLGCRLVWGRDLVVGVLCSVLYRISGRLFLINFFFDLINEKTIGYVKKKKSFHQECNTKKVHPSA
jgi:hypothetical protein